MLRPHIFRPSFYAVALCSALVSGCATSTVTEEVSVKSPPSVVTNVNPQAIVHTQLPGYPDLALQSWFEEARDTVGQELSADLSAVRVFVTDTTGIAVHAKTSLMHALEHDLDNSRFAENLVENILTLQTESVLAIYAPTVKQILLHDRNLIRYLDQQPADNKKQALQALLIHELVHAADDHNHDAFKHHSMSYQEVFAKSAVLEGHAQWQTRRICNKLNCNEAFASLNHYMFNAGSPDDPALQYVQNRSLKNLEFVYKEGERFIDKLKQREQSEQALNLAFSNPPRDSIQIIDPDSFPDRARETRNDRLSGIVEKTKKPWKKNSTGSLKRNVLAAAAFSVDPSSRLPIVNFYTSKVLAATKHEYYDHASDTPIPVAVIALQTDKNTTARKTASLIFESTLSTYNQLQGDLVEIDHWTKQQHDAEFLNDQGKQSTIEMHTASAYIRNGLVEAEYPVEVVTAISGNYLVHIDGRYVNGSHDLMQFAGRLLVTMQGTD